MHKVRIYAHFLSQTPRKMRPQQRMVIRLEFPSSQNMDHWTIAGKAF